MSPLSLGHARLCPGFCPTYVILGYLFQTAALACLRETGLDWNPEGLPLIESNQQIAAGGIDMASGTVDKIVGTVKEAIGKITGNKRTQTEGKTDQVKGDVKNATGNVTESAKSVRDSVAGRPEAKRVTD